MSNLLILAGSAAYLSLKQKVGKRFACIAAYREMARPNIAGSGSAESKAASPGDENKEKVQ